MNELKGNDVQEGSDPSLRSGLRKEANLTPERRDLIVAEAYAWVKARTPYVPHARVRGLGCDCATFILCVYRDLGFAPDIELGNYSVQAHLHRAYTEYIDTILRYADEIPEWQAEPGDLVVFKVARAYAHGAIVITPPSSGRFLVIHSMTRIGVIQSDDQESFLKGRQRRFFRRNFSKG